MRTVIPHLTHFKFVGKPTLRYEECCFVLDILSVDNNIFTYVVIVRS
jgi:hypothetical protein